MKPDSNASPDAVTEDALHALVDGRLDPAQRSALLARLARDPQAHATWQAWQQQREALSGLHRDLLDAQLPPALAAAARRASAGRGQAERGWRWGGHCGSRRWSRSTGGQSRSGGLARAPFLAQGGILQCLGALLRSPLLVFG